jgi:D-sedoheptulose 7-phosphate isomerase
MTVGLVGADGGEVTRRNLVDIALVVRSDSIPRIQEAHASLYHVLRETIEVTAGGGA